MIAARIDESGQDVDVRFDPRWSDELVAGDLPGALLEVYRSAVSTYADAVAFAQAVAPHAGATP